MWNFRRRWKGNAGHFFRLLIRVKLEIQNRKEVLRRRLAQLVLRNRKTEIASQPGIS